MLPAATGGQPFTNHFSTAFISCRHGFTVPLPLTRRDANHNFSSVFDYRTIFSERTEVSNRVAIQVQDLTGVYGKRIT
jgi:hypothetical protein